MHRGSRWHPISPHGGRFWGVTFALLTGLVPAHALAQDLTPSFPGRVGAPREPHVVRWWEAAAVAGAISAVLLDDQHVLHEVREHPTNTAGDLASVFRLAGDVKVYTALSLGTLGAGLVTRDAGLTRTGAQLAASGTLAAASFGLLKVVTGRSRPDAEQGTYQFSPFTSGGSLPSGHTAMAFALATTLSDALHSTLATVGLYVVATGTAWSRVYDERHWPSDVALGAALGVTAAKLVDGHWRLFHLRMPGFLLTPNRAGLELRF